VTLADYPGMQELEFVNLLIVAAAAFAAPFLLGLAPALRIPAVVLEIVVGIVIGPAGLGWVEVDAPVEVLALVGLAFLLFLAGLEIEVDRLRGRVLGVTLAGFGLSFAIALAVGGVLGATGIIDSPLLVAIILCATSLGIVVPVLKDQMQVGSSFGQLVIAAATIADFGAVILLSVFFSREGAGVGAQLVLLGAFAAAAVLGALAIAGVEHSVRIRETLLRLQDTTSQIRVRAAFLLMVGFVALAQGLGLEVILGSFAAGVILTIVDRDRAMTHPDFRLKLEAAGFGFFIPVFFVTSGLRFNLDALFASTSAMVQVPLFLVALLLVRGVPALLYRPLIGARQTAVSGLLQATSLPFIVAAAMIGMELGRLDEATGAALISAGLLSVLIFPAVSLSLLQGRRQEPAAPPPGIRLEPGM
jgi:Kef-type K+ transport system membrane component KefB